MPKLAPLVQGTFTEYYKFSLALELKLDCLAWKEGLFTKAPASRKRRRTVAASRLLTFEAQETHFLLENPLENPTGKWISTDTVLQYSITPWTAGDPKSGWLGEGSLKFAVQVIINSILSDAQTDDYSSLSRESMSLKNLH